MASRAEIQRFLDTLLDARTGADYCPNGLQVEGCEDIRHIVCGVTSSLSLITAAVDRRADAVIVHHGLFWGTVSPLTGALGRRVRTLVKSDMNLFAYHLPLDRHLEVGNAASLAARLGVTDLQPFGLHKGLPVGVRGLVPETSILDFGGVVASALGRTPVVYPYGPASIRQVGIITGGADRDIDQAIAAGLDVYVTGEVSEPTLHTAKEEGIHFIAGGHHATERYGVQALCQRLAEAFDVTWEYVEIENPA